MDLLLVLTYSAVCIVVFKVFKILSINGLYPLQYWAALFSSAH